MNHLLRLTNRLGPVDRPISTGIIPGSAELDVYGGYERRTPADRYRWDGRRRGGDARRPSLLVQYTVEGSGEFVDASGGVRRVPPGHLFTAVIPSRHVYLLPSDCPAWSFFWVMIRHPYVVDRLAKLQVATGPVLPAPPEGELAVLLLELLLALRAGHDDRFARERRLFDLLIAFERVAQARLHMPDERERLLAAVSRKVHGDALDRLNIEDLAAEFGTSRSNFSHRFRAVTGLTPAAYLRDLRLERARDLLLRTREPLKSIARLTGFADNNHFTKAFRRRFGFTPGGFRRQLQSN